MPAGFSRLILESARVLRDGLLDGEHGVEPRERREARVRARARRHLRLVVEEPPAVLVLVLERVRSVGIRRRAVAQRLEQVVERVGVVGGANLTSVNSSNPSSSSSDAVLSSAAAAEGWSAGRSGGGGALDLRVDAGFRLVARDGVHGERRKRHLVRAARAGAGADPHEPAGRDVEGARETGGVVADVERGGEGEGDLPRRLVRRGGGEEGGG